MVVEPLMHWLHWYTSSCLKIKIITRKFTVSRSINLLQGDPPEIQGGKGAGR